MTSDSNTINILFAASEAEPFVKVGGLGDVAGALPKAILRYAKTLAGKLAIDLRMVLPYHAAIKSKPFNPEKLGTFTVNTLNGPVPCDVYLVMQEGLPVYLLDGEAIDDTSPVYHADPVLDGNKYSFFSVFLVELAKFLNWRVDILHANDWHTASAIYALKTKYKKDPFFKNTATILSLHNMPFNGYGAQEALTLLGIPPSEDENLPEWAKHTPLPLGLLTADRIIAVSPTYAKEIFTPEFGCGLEDFMKTRVQHVMGILNGIDLDIWNPQIDQYIVSNYTVDTLAAKTLNKTDLQSTFGLPLSPDTPLLTLISRMDNQKGIDIALRGLHAITDENWQAIFLGTGNPDIEHMAIELSEQYPQRIKAVTKFDAILAHRLYAGADIFLMPSRYEPCGISQMISMLYGTIPVARATGGLADTIIHYRANADQATGFLFTRAYPSVFANALLRALKTYHNKAVWSKLQRNGMLKDFSWNQSAASYVDVYRQLAHK